MSQTQAFNEGWGASKVGLPIESNPHVAGTGPWRDWNRGFNSHDSFKLRSYKEAK